MAAPQQLHAGILGVAAHCGRVLEAKERTLASARALLARRDEQYARLLRVQVRPPALRLGQRGRALPERLVAWEGRGNTPPCHLPLQGEETDALIAAMHAAAERCRAGQEEELEAAEAAYLQARGSWAGWCEAGGSGAMLLWLLRVKHHLDCSLQWMPK